MGKIEKFIIGLFFVGALAFGLQGCADDAKVAKQNLTKAADNFELVRRIVFHNTWTDKVIMVIEGKCSIEHGGRVSVICKTGPDTFKRTFITLSGQVTVVTEQMEAVAVNVYHYRRTFKPQTIIPDIDFRGSTDAMKVLLPDSND